MKGRFKTMLKASPCQVALALLSRQPCVRLPFPYCGCCASTDAVGGQQLCYQRGLRPSPRAPGTALRGLRWLHRLRGEA